MTRPNLLIIGATRSATTALARALAAHPEVFMTEPKEPHFFAFSEKTIVFRGPGDDLMVNRVAITQPDDYLALYRTARNEVLRGDGSVSTLYYTSHSIESIRRVRGT